MKLVLFNENIKILINDRKIVVLDNCATNEMDNHDDNNRRDARPCVIRNIPIRKPKSISSFVAGFKSAVNSKIDDYIDLHQLKYSKIQ